MEISDTKSGSKGKPAVAARSSSKSGKSSKASKSLKQNENESPQKKEKVQAKKKHRDAKVSPSRTSKIDGSNVTPRSPTHQGLTNALVL